MPSAECRGGPTPWDEAELRRAAAKAWHEHGTILLRPEWITSWDMRAMVEQAAAGLYGERKG